jgi:hypothetical protein
MNENRLGVIVCGALLFLAALWIVGDLVEDSKDVVPMAVTELSVDLEEEELNEYIITGHLILTLAVVEYNTYPTDRNFEIINMMIAKYDEVLDLLCDDQRVVFSCTQARAYLEGLEDAGFVVP